jgi:hypothetical protein
VNLATVEAVAKRSTACIPGGGRGRGKVRKGGGTINVKCKRGEGEWGDGGGWVSANQ